MWQPQTKIKPTNDGFEYATALLNVQFARDLPQAVICLTQPPNEQSEL